jgi:flagellin-like hook-associated protein FlgL
MTISGISSRSALSMQTLVDMRLQLDDLQRQLGTGRRSDTYAGIGIERGLSVTLNSQLAGLASFNSSIEQVGVRLTLAQTTLGQIDNVAHQVKTTAMTSKYAIDGSGRTADQRSAADQLDLMVGLLNTSVGDRYLFSGRSFDQLPVESPTHILDGDGARAGLRQLISERRQADLGASGLGRLLIPASVGATLSVGEDVAGSPFGFKLAAAVSTLSGATVTGPGGGPPPSVGIDLGPTNPNAGETLRLTFNLPDGTTTELKLTATNASPPGANEFTIGADTTATAANLQAALTTAVGNLAGSTLAAASAMAAGEDFFNADVNNPPMRVAGPPYDSATGFTPGTSADTVIWYTGEAGSDPARSTAGVRIDTSISVSYGMRANEQALRLALQNVAVFAAVSYSTTDPQAENSYAALKQRVSINLAPAQGQQKIEDIESDLAGTQAAMQAASARHQQTETTLSGLLDSIRNIPPEEVGAQILALQTNLQATLQTTALLLRTSLVNYL